MDRYQICEGVGLNVSNTAKFKNNYMSVSFAVPLSREYASMGALLPLVLTHATKNYPSMEKISYALDMLYASSITTRCFKKGEVQFFGFNIGFLNDSYDLDGCNISGGTLSILNEMIFYPYLTNGIFDENIVETEKKNLCDRIAAQINDKNSYAITRANLEMCRDESYGISALGEICDVEKITAKSLYDYYLKVLTEAQIEIFFVGDYTDTVKNEIYKYLDFKPRVVKPLKTSVIRRAQKVREVDESQNVVQGKLSLGFRTGKVLSDGDYYKFVVFNEIYGGSPVSKLFMNVREKLSLCYYCRSIPEPQKGVMIVGAGIEVSNMKAAKDEILAQLEEIRNGNITDDELQAAYSAILDSYRAIDDTPESVEQWYLGRMLADLNDSPLEACELIKTVTKEDVSEIARGITLDTVYFMHPIVSEEGRDE